MTRRTQELCSLCW